jgi:hypothetical protein
MTVAAFIFYGGVKRSKRESGIKRVRYSGSRLGVSSEYRLKQR